MIKKILPIIIVAIVVGGGGFYGGMKFGESKKSANGNFPNFQNLSAEQRQQMLAGGRTGNGQNGTGFANGDIIAKDDKTITLKLRDGGSKIIFFSDTTQISKFAQGGANDLVVGGKIIVNGTQNQDGSITAKTIQLQPETNN